MNGVVQTKPAPSSRTEAPSLSIWQATILAALVLWLYVPILVRLVTQWWRDPNFAHGFFVAPFSIFVLWHDRARLSRMAPRPSSFGLLLLGFAMLVLIVGQLGAELFLARFSLLLVVAGAIVLFGGWNFFRAALFPWAFLILMIPLPAILYNHITFPLQILASRVAASVLALLGVPVLREGNIINLSSLALEVADACSGIRSLMSLITVAIIYGFVNEKRLWIRWLIALSSVPIAVTANSLRIIGTGLLVQYWNPDMAKGYFHASWGWIVFVLSVLMLYAFHQLIHTLWRHEGRVTS